MKKVILLPALLLAAIQLKAQDAIMFKMVYQPKTTYTVTGQMKTTMNMAPVGQPIDMKMDVQNSSVITTGAPDANKNIPLTFTTKTGTMNMTMNGQAMPGMDAGAGTQSQMFGTYSADGKLHIDSIAGKKLGDDAHNAMIKVIDGVQNGLKFPDHPIKIGETFTQETPFDLPLPGVAGSTGNKATAKMTYTLLSITGNIAAFSIVQALTVNADTKADTQSVQLKMTGDGSGSVTYDIKKQFFTSMTNNLNMSYDIDVAGMNVKGTGTVSNVSKTDITSN